MSSGYPGAPRQSLDRLLDSLWKPFQSEDAELVEINPLAVVGDGLIALDAKVIIEDDAAFRHPEYAEIRDDRTPLEEIAREKEIAFVQLDGNIGVIANGAGLTMATLDVLKEFGGNPGVFLDLGGTDDPQKVTEAFLLMARRQARGGLPEHLRRGHPLRHGREGTRRGDAPGPRRRAVPARRPDPRQQREGGDRDPSRRRASPPSPS